MMIAKFMKIGEFADSINLIPINPLRFNCLGSGAENFSKYLSTKTNNLLVCILHKISKKPFVVRKKTIIYILY